jgi:hypothetical protein
VEGEKGSCLFAFHEPGDALAFSLELQESLLHLPYPQSVVDHVMCKELYLR